MEGNSKNNSSSNDRFLRLLMGSQRQIYSYILASVHNISDADDIMQDVSTVMWNRFNDYDSNANFTAWGIGIARNMILAFFRKKKNSRVSFDEKIFETLELVALTKAEKQDHRSDFLERCIKRLAPKEKKLIELRYDRNIKTSRIADLVGLSVDVVYKTMSRIHAMLELCIKAKMREEDLI